MTDTLPRSESEMFVYEIAPTNDGRVHVYILVPGQGELVGLPIEEAKRFAGDLSAAIGRHEHVDIEPVPLSASAQRALNFAHRYIEMNGHPPTLDDIADYVGTSRRSLKRTELRELEQKGWYSHGVGHRDGSWGGTYKRPMSPPFVKPKATASVNGQLLLLPEMA